MGVLSFFKGRNISKRSTTRSLDEIEALLGGGSTGTSMSGEPVNWRNGLRVSAVLACVKVIADGCATPDFRVYRETKEGKRELARNIPEYRMLNRRPNEWQTSFDFRRTMTMHAALCGDALAIKVKSGSRVRELIPVEPGNFQIIELSRYDVRYRCYDKFGLIGEFGPEDVLHIPNLRWEMIKSLDVIGLAREAVGLSIAAERSQATLHANGGRPSGILTTPQKLTDEVVDRLKVNWQKFNRSNRNGVAVLDNDMKFMSLSDNNSDQQALEQRRFQIEEVARPFGVFPIMIGHSDKAATFASSEAFFSAHLIHCLAPWHKLWCERIDEFVLDGSGPLYVEFDTRYLTRGSMKDRAEWSRTMIEMQIMTRNEVRDEFGLDSVDGGDVFWSPANIAGKNNVQSVEQDAGQPVT
jgi:HK97 family phage portal protein